jgi:hypothetical protein
VSDNPKSTMTRLIGVAALAVCAVLGVVAPAAASMPSSTAPASQGSVPSEISRYAADPEGLLARLDDLFGVTTSGQGIDFDDTTKVGQLNRAWVFTQSWLQGGAADDPVELVNLWTAPITIADKPVGLATIWINTTTDAPDLADFDRSASSAAALMDVPAEAQLVRDEPREAWFTLVEGQLTPLIAGTSGVDAATPLTTYQRTITGTEPPPAPASDLDGLLGAGIVAGAAVLVVLVVLLLPILRRHAGDNDPDEGLSESTAAITLPTKAELKRYAEREAAAAAVKAAAAAPKPDAAFAPEPEPEPATTVEKTPTAVEETPAAAKPATPRKPAAAKPATQRKPAAAKTGSTRSVAAKPTAAKPAAAKPTATKTTAAKSAPKTTAPKPTSTRAGAGKPPNPPKETTTP